MLNRFSPVVIGLLTLIIYFLTVLPESKPIIASFFMVYFLLSILSFILLVFLYQNKSNSTQIRLSFLLLVGVVLLWVGITGWFISPFYYLLFLLAISIGFIFSSLATITFVLILMLIFLPNVGSIDIFLDMIMLASLAAIIPLNYFVKKGYLKLRESEKKLLILKEQNREYKNKVDQLLNNKIVKLAIEIRQPASDIKQIASFSTQQAKTEYLKKKLQSINVLSEVILKRIEDFEHKTTGEELIHKK